MTIFLLFLALKSWSAELTLSLGSTSASGVISKIEKAFEKETGIKLKYCCGSGSSGYSADRVMADVDNKRAEAGGGAIDWFDWLSLMHERKIPIQNISEMKFKVIGRDRIVVTTHADGPARLSNEQLRKVFSGEVRNFKEVGGPNQEIHLVYHPRLVATGRAFKSKFLGKREFYVGPGVIQISDPEPLNRVAEIVAATPGGIGFGSRDIMLKGSKIVVTETVGRPITMVWIGKPSLELDRLLTFIELKGAQYGVDQ